uniref:Serpentine receptor class gamma n=1 Tax=Acrobeloides nanus TaxID=290746 RepID=A0A914E9S8_9BILA
MDNNSPEPIICGISALYVPWKNYITPITLAYGLPLLCLNARVIWVLMKNRKKEELNSSFYMVFVLASITDSLFWIVNEIVARITMTPITNFILDWMPTRGVITSGIFFLSAYLFFAEMHITILTSLNRLISVVFPFSHKLRGLSKNLSNPGKKSTLGLS